VLAAASLQEAMEYVADAWEAQGHPRPVLSFAGTSSLARQIEAGAPADIFISADEQWMDFLEDQGLIDAYSRRDLLRNSLVLVGGQAGDASWQAEVPLADVVGSGRIAVADTQAVPAGRYARAALESLGDWETLEGQLVPTENVRAALALVERGEVPFGIVYATDAQASTSVAIAGQFPGNSHPPIIYPVAMLASSTQTEADAFLAFLGSEEARRIFAGYGFGIAR